MLAVVYMLVLLALVLGVAGRYPALTPDSIGVSEWTFSVGMLGTSCVGAYHISDKPSQVAFTPPQKSKSFQDLDPSYK